MKIKVNPTRQELLELKKKLERAKTGHDLLEDKLESLMQEFLNKIKKIKNLRKKIENNVPQLYYSFFELQATLGQKQLSNLISSVPKLKVDTSPENIVGVKTERYKAQNKEEVLSYSFGSEIPVGFVSQIQKSLKEIFNDLLLYASLEQQVRALADEITTTRRRVNALEYVFIPQMEEGKKYISQKLEENERFTRALLMKLKAQLID